MAFGNRKATDPYANVSDEQLQSQLQGFGYGTAYYNKIKDTNPQIKAITDELAKRGLEKTTQSSWQSYGEGMRPVLEINQRNKEIIDETGWTPTSDRGQEALYNILTKYGYTRSKDPAENEESLRAALGKMTSELQRAGGDLSKTSFSSELEVLEEEEDIKKKDELRKALAVPGFILGGTGIIPGMAGISGALAGVSAVVPEMAPYAAAMGTGMKVAGADLSTPIDKPTGEVTPTDTTGDLPGGTTPPPGVPTQTESPGFWDWLKSTGVKTATDKLYSDYVNGKKAQDVYEELRDRSQEDFGAYATDAERQRADLNRAQYYNRLYQNESLKSRGIKTYAGAGESSIRDEEQSKLGAEQASERQELESNYQSAMRRAERTQADLWDARKEATPSWKDIITKNLGPEAAGGGITKLGQNLLPEVFGEPDK